MVFIWPFPHLRLMNLIYQLMGRKGKPPISRSTEARNLEINQDWSPNPRLTSRAGALTRKATFLTLGQEYSKNFPKRWSKFSNILDQHTVTANTQTSWLIPKPPSPTQRCLPSLIWSPRSQKHIHRWLTSINRTSMKPPAKISGIWMSMNQTCTRYTIFFWSKHMNNYNRRWHRTPPSRQSFLKNTQ